MIFPVFYFGPVSYFAKLIQQPEYQFETHENFQKQTFRNRCNIQGANGKLRLVIPIEHDGARVMKDIKVSDSSGWRKEHLKSLISAYKSAPFFEFYEDDLMPILENQDQFLLDINFKTIAFIDRHLKLDLKFNTTQAYNEIPKHQDFRNHFNAKSETPQVTFPEYMQVFGEKFAFMPDLSILDLLFNEGPKAAVYLANLEF
ncbi:MAG: WbqC family protein [Weeksellaceae bacterium]